MDKNVKFKEIIFSLSAIIVLFAIVVAISFAAFNYLGTGEKANTINSGIINMSYSEPDNGINLVNALPISDEQGKLLSGSLNVFDFTIEAKIVGNATINYAITAVKGESTVDDSAIKVYLTKVNNNLESVVLEPTKISNLSVTTGSESYQPSSGEFILFNDSITNSITDNYRLRMWVSDDYTISNGGTYTLRVNVYGTSPAL